MVGERYRPGDASGEGMRVHTHTEWDPLREVVIGSARGARLPCVKDESLHSVNHGDLGDAEFEKVRTGPYPRRVIDETEEDLAAFCEALRALDIKVHRPIDVDFSELRSTADWTVDGVYAYCPRDPVLTVGEEAIETPMVLRHRQHEAERTLRPLFSCITVAPRPRLLDTMYDRSVLGRFTLRDREPAFDAANVLKCGRDIVFQVSNTGNYRGAAWLQEHLGSEYRVHPVDDLYAFIHIDSTIVPLRPGLVLFCPDRVTPSNVPRFFEGWDVIWCPEPNPVPCDPSLNPSSKWIAMNILSLRPDLVAVEKNQTNLMRELARYGIDSLPVSLRHMRSLGGGPHCVSLDIVRDGELHDYS